MLRASRGHLRLYRCTALTSEQYLSFSFLPATQREQLIEVITKLLGAWGHPLSQLHWSINSDQVQDQDQDQDKNQDLSHYRTNKALEISNMVRELSHGVAIMVEKVRVHPCD